MNDALAAVVSQSQSKKVSTSFKARQYKSSAPRTWLEWTPSQKSLCVQLFLEGNYNHVVLRYGCQAPPLNTLRTWAGKVQEGEPLEGYGTNSVLSRTEEETILKFIKELKYEAAVIDLDTIAALGRTVAEKSRGPGLAPVLDRQWAANFRRRHKMGCLKKITTERLPSTVSDLALDNKWRREFLDLVEQPQKYGVRIPEGECQSLPPWAQLGLDETPLQYAPKLRGGYAAGEQEGQRWRTTLTSCQSQAYHLYKEQQRGGLRPGWTDLPKGFVLHHVMYMLSVWPGRTGKGQVRCGRQCRLRMMKALRAVQ